MKPLFDDIFRRGLDDILNPDRFREILVIVFTGLGENPGEIVRVLAAWMAAVVIADKIYPRR